MTFLKPYNTLKIILFILLTVNVITSCTKTEETILPELPNSYKSTITNFIPNGGGTNTTDWLGNKLQPDYWSVKGKAKINSGIHWQGQYLQVSSRSQFYLISPGVNETKNSEWKLNFYYRSNTKVRIAVKYSETCTYCIAVLPVADKVQYYSVKFKAPVIFWLKWYNSPIEPGFIEIDQVELR